MGNRLFKFFLKYRTALPLCSFLVYLNTANAVLGGIGPKALLCGLSFFVLVQLSYIYDALFRTREDAVNLPGGPEGSGRAWPVFAAAAAPAAYIAWLGFWPMIAIAFLIIPFYSDPSLTGRRLKTIPVLKSLVSVLNFWLVGIVVPVLLAHDLSAALLVFLLRSSGPMLFFVFLLTVLLDVRDVQGDREGGVATIPVLLGPRATAGAVGALFAAGAWYSFSDGNTYTSPLLVLLAVFSFLAVKPRGRAFYEWMLAAVNAFLAVRLFLPA